MLELTNVRTADEGSYLCIADNGITSDRKMINLTVVGECRSRVRYSQLVEALLIITKTYFDL